MLFKCRDITEKASEYLDKKLSPWQRFKFSLHLFICVHCKRYMHQLRLTLASLARLEQTPETSDARVEEIVAMLHHHHHTHTGKPHD